MRSSVTHEHNVTIRDTFAQRPAVGVAAFDGCCDVVDDPAGAERCHGDESDQPPSHHRTLTAGVTASSALTVTHRWS